MKTSLSTKTVRKDFHLPLEIAQDAAELSKESGLTFSEIVRLALVEFVENHKKAQRAQQLKEAGILYRATDKAVADEWSATETKV